MTDEQQRQDLMKKFLEGLTGRKDIADWHILVLAENGDTLTYHSKGTFAIYGALDFIKRMMWMRMGKAAEQKEDPKP